MRPLAHHPRTERRERRRRRRRTGHPQWERPDENPDLEEDEEWIAVQEF